MDSNPLMHATANLDLKRTTFANWIIHDHSWSRHVTLTPRPSHLQPLPETKLPNPTSPTLAKCAEEKALQSPSCVAIRCHSLLHLITSKVQHWRQSDLQTLNEAPQHAATAAPASSKSWSSTSYWDSQFLQPLPNTTVCLGEAMFPRSERGSDSCPSS